MFGYVTICEPELKMKDWRKYRAYYCGLCKTLRERHGHIGQMTLSYDMTFAVILLTSLYESEPAVSEHRCKTHPLKKQKMLQNEITEYCADMNILLTYYHLEDNWKDEKKLSGLAGASVLKRKAKEIARQYPRQSRVIAQELENLARYEKADSQNIDEPAGCFGCLMAELLVYREDAWEKTLREIGFFLGKFIYIMDAYEDLEKDLQEGCYNPLRTLYEELGKTPAYEERCYEILCMMIAEASAAFEKLPCLWDVDILRNILYAGVWAKFEKLKEKDKKQQTQTEQEQDS